jgi:hypothetical protein
MRLKFSVLTSGLAIAGLVSAPVAWGQTVAPAALPSAATDAAFVASFAGKSIAATDNVSLVFANEAAAADGQFAVIVGTEDLTANFRWVSPTQLDGVFAAMPLPVGTSELKVFKITNGNQWQELGKIAITVEAPAGDAQGAAKAPLIKPTLILGVKSQLAEAHSAAATPPARARYADLTLQAGIQTEHGASNWSLKSQANVVGSSFQPEALDFANRGNTAPKVDLANYLIEGSVTSGAGITALSLGHVQAGTNPLLANAIANRGLSLSHKFNSRFDIAAAVQNGTAVVGGNNLSGLNDAEHRLNTVTAGVEVLERAGGLRVEATGFSGVVKPKLTTGVATLQDAEESKGYALRAKAQNEAGSLRAELALARSTYTPKGDSTLNIAPGPSTLGNTWYADLAYDLLKNIPVSKDFALSVTVQGKHEYASAAYKSIGAGQAANYVNDTIGLNTTLGVITSQLQLGKRADNVDNAAAFLKNRTNLLNLTIAAPLGQLLDSAKPPVWAPTASYTYGRNHTLADTAFIPTSQTQANLPNVNAITHGLSLNWTIDKLTFGYQHSRSLQDNQQLGLEPNDVSDVGHTLTSAYQVSDKLSFTGGAGTRSSVQRVSGVKRNNDTAQAGVNWLFGQRYTYTTNLSTARDRDSLLTTNTKTLQAQLQLLKQFDLNAFGSKLPGQWTLGYTHNHTNSLGIVVRYQTLNAALSLAFF